MEIYVKRSVTERLTGQLRRQSSVVTIDFEVLRQEKERKSSVDGIAAGTSMHPPNGRLKSTRDYRRNRLLQIDRERKTCERVRERQYGDSGEPLEWRY